MVLFSYYIYTFLYLIFGSVIGVAENNALGAGYLVIKKLSEIFKIHLASYCVYNCYKTVYLEKLAV